MENLKDINKTQTYLFRTYINHPNNNTAMYKGSDGKIYEQSYGLPIKEISEEFAMNLAWLHINRCGGFPIVGSGWDKKIAISKEAQDLKCKQLLQLI